jgi:TPR repeat protein
LWRYNPLSRSESVVSSAEAILMNGIKADQQEQHEDAVKQRAASGDASAQYEMARLRMSSNPAESFEWLQKAANQGHVCAQASLKDFRQQQKDDAIKQGAANGDASAQYEMARLLLSSNPAESFEWLQRAGNQGHAGAQASLGQMYTHDQYFSSFNAYESIPPADIPEDYTKAANWFLKAAVQGDSYSQRRLGDLYKFGQGVPRSREQAAAWYSHAAGRGDSAAQRLLGDLYCFGAGVPQDYTHAALWYQRAAEDLSYSGILSLGYLYLRGHGVQQDYVEAYFWFEVARVLFETYRWNFNALQAALHGYRVDVPVSGKPETFNLESVEERDQAASHLTQGDVSRAQARVQKWVEEHTTEPQ